MPQPWYSIRAGRRSGDPKAEASRSAEIFIYGDIGESWWDETVTARQFVKDIAALDVDELTVRINSVGGSVPDGIAIYNAIKRHRASVTVAIDGQAQSIASLIAMAGDIIEMAENAVLMIHAPWSYAVGNSADLRDTAYMLDQWADAMATSYAAKTGKDHAEVLALLTDGIDHRYTAAEALAAGFVDIVVSAMPVAASAVVPAAALARYSSAGRHTVSQTAAAAAQTSRKETFTMPNTATPQAAAPQPANPKQPTAAEVLAADKARRTAVRAEFAPFEHVEAVAALRQQCEDDPDCTAEVAAKRILGAMAKDVQAVGATHIETVEDESDKRRDSVVSALLVRAGVADSKTREKARASAHRGAKLLDIARASLDRAGIKYGHMDQMQIVAAAFTQGTSDFPILLENAMHKALQTAYTAAPDTWSRFCKTGTVSDFRAHSRYRIGSLGSLDSLNELGEFKNKTIPDGEKGSITADTKGNIINLSRKAIINDDLGAFIGLAAQLGRAGRRTVEVAVYALLAENAGLGPLMEDSKTLFHADHGNIGTGSALTVAGIDADRVLMGSQTDIGGDEFLDLRPAVLLVPLALGSTGRVINEAQYDPDTANKLQKPNVCAGLFRDVVDSPRLTGTRRYLFADADEAPVIEVAFLDGNQEPYVEQQAGFTVDGTQYKVRLDFGVGAIDYRGAVTNTGVAAG